MYLTVAVRDGEQLGYVVNPTLARPGASAEVTERDAGAGGRRTGWRCTSIAGASRGPRQPTRCGVRVLQSRQARAQRPAHRGWPATGWPRASQRANSEARR